MTTARQTTRSPYPVFAYQRYDIPESMPRFDLARIAAGRKSDEPVLRSLGQTDDVDLEGDGMAAEVRPRFVLPERKTGRKGIPFDEAPTTYPRLDLSRVQSFDDSIYRSPGVTDGMDLEGDGVREPASPYSARRNFADMLRNPVTDKNGRLRSGANMALLGPTTPTDSIGNAIGQRLGNLVGGLLRPKSDEESERQRELPRARAAAEVESAQERQQREDEKAKNEGELTKAQTEYWKARPKLDLDKAKETSLGRRRTQLLGQIRTQGHYKRGENVALDAQLDDAEVSVSDFDKNADSFTWHESGGQGLVVNKKGETRAATLDGAPIVDASKKPDPTTGLTPVQAAQVKQHELDRVSREKIANEYVKLQGQRNNLSASEFGLRQQQFKAHYPGFGKAPLKLSELEAAQRTEDSRAQRLGTQPRDLRKQATDQGYTVDEEN